MNVNFDNDRLKDVCNNDKKLQKQFGKQNAGKIKRRLDDLRAINTLEDAKYIAGRCHALRSDRSGEFALDLEHPDRLIFKPNHPIEDITKDGNVIWSRVTDITITEIANYHGK